MKLEDLKLYQECLDFEQKIWDIVKEWEGFNKDAMGKSFLQSADAISGNIASGYGRYNFKDKKHYCYISRGYLLKTKGWIIKSRDRELLGTEESEELLEFIEKIHRMLNAYIRSIGRKKSDNDNNRSNNYSNDYNNSNDTNDSNESEESEESNQTEEAVVDGNSFTADADEFFSSDELTSNA